VDRFGIILIWNEGRT